MKVCVVIPTYNERDSIKTLIPAVFRAGVPAELHVLVVDDNSPDGTAQEVQRLQKVFPRLHLLSRSKKQGLGAAYIAGMQHALTTLNPGIIFEMDADFSHDPNDLARLFAATKDHELVIGSRYVPGGSIIGWNVWRKLVSAGGNVMSRTVARLPIHDCTAGFRAWDAALVQRIGLEKLNVTGYAFQLSSLHSAHRLGARITEIPVTFTERREGKSKMRTSDIIEFVLTSVRLGFR